MYPKPIVHCAQRGVALQKCRWLRGLPMKLLTDFVSIVVQSKAVKNL